MKVETSLKDDLGMKGEVKKARIIENKKNDSGQTETIEKQKQSNEQQ